MAKNNIVTLTTKVVNVRVEHLRPKYNNLKDWMNEPNNVYIGRKCVVFAFNNNGMKERFPKEDSIWANPFKIDSNNDRDAVIEKYKRYINEKLNNNDGLFLELLNLLGKNLGCWCHPEPCHGDVLLELLRDAYRKIAGIK